MGPGSARPDVAALVSAVRLELPLAGSFSYVSRGRSHSIRLVSWPRRGKSSGQYPFPEESLWT